MRSGRMKFPMTLQRSNETTGADGVVTLAWVNVGEVWAEKIAVGTRESMFAVDSMSTAEQVEIIIRRLAYADMSPACRFVYDRKTYEVSQVVLDDSREQSWRCLCQARAM